MLVPEEILAGREDELRRLLTSSEISQAIDPFDDFYGLALRRALLFARWPSLLKDRHELTEQIILYNYYYWHSVFCKLYTIKNGFDVEIEQASIQILGTTKIAIDWSIVEQIDQLVEHEVAGWIARHP